MNDPEIIDWLNSDFSDDWRRRNCRRVGYSVAGDDGQDAEPYLEGGGRVSFASLKFDDSENEHDVWHCADFTVESQQAYMVSLRRAFPDNPDVRCLEILWDGFVWDPDLDPSRA